MTRRGSWTSRLTFAAILAGVFAACGVPEYRFTDEEPHCRNGVLDFEFGETGVDCAGDCLPCGDGEPCVAAEDCLGGQCLDQRCLGEACGNGELDPDEMATDCGGPCAPCAAGAPCVEDGGCESGVCADAVCQPPSCSDDVTNGSETGEDCGGGDCNPCRGGEQCEAGSDCISKMCNEDFVCTSSCMTGFLECDGSFDVECETNINVDPENCGGCGTTCELAHATPACNSAKCTIDECEEPFVDCDSEPDTGCETNVTADIEHCGACLKRCSDTNGTPDCVDSRCRIECSNGFDNCDGDVDNGCETRSSFDTQNCGRCRAICPRGDDDEEPFCKAGECGATACPEGRGDCDGDGDCDFDLTSDPDSCDTCGTPCVVNNGEPSCSDRVCGIDSCDDGYDNCDADAEDGGYANGCETNIADDVKNCGGCGIVCELENGTAKCVDGECRVATCDPPFDDCDGDGLDCEANTETNRRHCGACGTDCNDELDNATGTCSEGVCQVAECDDGYDDCTSANGCETALASSEANCGACGTECVDVGGTNVCSSGECDPECAEPNRDCDDSRANGCEANTLTDPDNCGGCGFACVTPPGTGTNECYLGSCNPTCSGSHQSCDSDVLNGCETDTSTDEAHCGGCQRPCQAPAGTETNECSDGVCHPACALDYGDCDTIRSNGCEEYLLGNVDHCGECNIRCQTTNAASTACSSAGVCQPACQENYAHCGSPELGCTVSLTTDSDCGACGAACSGVTSSCVGTDGEYRCQAPITLANGDVDGQGAGGLLTLTHTLRAGQSRMVLLAIAADSPGGNVSANKPETVRYGTTAMSFFAEQAGGTGTGDQWWGADIYIYYLTEADGLTAGTDVEVTIDGRSGTSPTALVANLVQLNGVDQASPLVLFRGATDRASASKEVSVTLPIEVSGSRIYSFTAGLWSPVPAYTVNPTAGSLIQTLNSPVVPASGDPQLRAAGLYVGDASAGELSEGNRSVSWNLGSANMATQLSVVIKPAIAE